MKNIILLGSIVLLSVGTANAQTQVGGAMSPPASGASSQEPESLNSLPPAAATATPQASAGSHLGASTAPGSQTYVPTSTIGQGPTSETFVSPVQGNR